MHKLAILVAASLLILCTPMRPSERDVDWRTKLDLPLARAASTRGDEVRALIRVTRGSGPRVIERLAARNIPITASSAADLFLARLPRPLLATVANDPGVVQMSLDAPVRAMGGTLTSLSQNVLLGTQALLPRTYTGKNIGVAVVDSGLVVSADLDDAASYDFTTGKTVKTGPKDAFGHGTHVSGLVASTGSTTGGLYQGIAPGARLIVLKALDSTGVGYTSNVINAINFAVANKATLGIDVINLSLGHPIYEPAGTDPLVAAVERAVAEGIVVVVSAGNFGGDPVTREVGYAGITSPGNAPSAITVGALETYQTVARGDDAVAWYSSRGPTWYDGYQKPDIVAPGSHLASDVSSGSALINEYPRGVLKTSGTCKLMRLSGTSMAAGVVSGIVATMLEASQTSHPGGQLTPNAVKAILQYTAFEMPGEDVLTQGAGAVNAAGAQAMARSIDPTAPLGAGWLTTQLVPYTTVDGTPHAWGQRVIWGDRVIWGNQIETNDPA